MEKKGEYIVIFTTGCKLLSNVCESYVSIVSIVAPSRASESRVEMVVRVARCHVCILCYSDHIHSFT